MMETKEICQKLNQFIDEINVGGKHRVNLSLFGDVADRLEEQEAEIAELKQQLSRQQPEWVSVEDDKKPKEGESVFIYSANGAASIYFYFAEAGFPPSVTHWMKYEPPKPKEPTFKDKFLEAFPKAQLYSDGIPIACRANIFGEKCLMKSKCAECWNQPYFEEKGEGESGE